VSADGNAFCQSCGTPIRWVVTIGDRRMPLDVELSPAGNVVLVDVPGKGVRARVLTGPELPALEPAHVAHWTTCPNSTEFKRRARIRARAAAPRCQSCGEPLDPVLAARPGWYGRVHPGCAPVVSAPPRQAPDDEQGELAL